MILLLNFVVLIPLMGYLLIKKYKIKYKMTVMGLLIGSIIHPLVYGLYGLSFVPFIGIVFLPFLLLTLLFIKPAWYLLVIKTNIINGLDISVIDYLLLYIVNGIIWAIFFGFFGFIYDFLQYRKNRVSCHL